MKIAVFQYSYNPRRFQIHLGDTAETVIFIEQSTVFHRHKNALRHTSRHFLTGFFAYFILEK
jgi:hypothetical protein